MLYIHPIYLFNRGYKFQYPEGNSADPKTQQQRPPQDQPDAPTVARDEAEHGQGRPRLTLVGNQARAIVLRKMELRN